MTRFVRSCVLAVLLLGGAVHAVAARTPLAGPTTFWITPNGTDSGTTCAQASPCMTLQYATTMVQQNYDVAGQTVTFNACGLGDTTYGAGVLIFGPQDFVGHSAGPAQIVFLGDAANPGACVIKPVAAGYCFGAAYGAQYEIDGFKCDQSANPAAGQDEVAIGQGAKILLNGWVAGENTHPGNDFSVYGAGSELDVLSGYSVDKTVIQTTASFAAGATTISVASTTGIVPGMIPTGAGIPLSEAVMSVDPTNSTVTIGGSGSTTAAENGSTIYFVGGGAAHMSVTNGGVVLDETNCGVSPFAVTIGWAGYYAGFVYVASGGSVDLGASFSGPVAGYSYQAHTNGILETCGHAVPGQGGGPVDTGAQVQ